VQMLIPAQRATPHTPDTAQQVALA
jgi:hypothetical protein